MPLRLFGAASLGARSYIYCLRDDRECYLLAIDLNGDQHNEFDIVNRHAAQSGLFTFRNQHWQCIGYVISVPPFHNIDTIEALLTIRDVEAIEQAWRELGIGKSRFSVQTQD